MSKKTVVANKWLNEITEVVSDIKRHHGEYRDQFTILHYRIHRNCVLRQ